MTDFTVSAIYFAVYYILRYVTLLHQNGMRQVRGLLRKSLGKNIAERL